MLQKYIFLLIKKMVGYVGLEPTKRIEHDYIRMLHYITTPINN